MGYPVVPKVSHHLCTHMCILVSGNVKKKQGPTHRKTLHRPLHFLFVEHFVVRCLPLSFCCGCICQTVAPNTKGISEIVVIKTNFGCVGMQSLPEFIFYRMTNLVLVFYVKHLSTQAIGTSSHHGIMMMII